MVRPTDIFYPRLWTSPDLALGGAWMPSYWVRSRFEPADSVAATFKFGLLVQVLKHGNNCLNPILPHIINEEGLASVGLL